MIRLILITIFCIMVAFLSAAQISQNEAAGIASSWMRHINNENSIEEITPVVNPINSESIDWFQVTFTQGGFVLISADDLLIPILGYDLNANLNSEIPENMQAYLNQIHEEISVIRNTSSLPLHPDWQAVRSGDYNAFLPNRPVSPLIATNWDQDWPYNSMCPSDTQGPGGHVYVGCGATTMAQIMKFWAYPTQGTGSHTYYHSTYGSQTANFGATTYNFASMPNTLYSTPNTAISTLGYHCAIALDMDFGPDGSGSYATAVRPAFINYFNYESTAQLVYKYGYTTANWETLLRNEMDAGRPVYYFGQDTTYGGHAFVLDGYQGTNYFHFNWGWSGYYNGYFYVSNLNPGMYQFNSSQGAVVGIQPTVPVSAPSNLVATVDAGNNIFLEWESPVTRSLEGFTVYKDDALFAVIDDPFSTYYFDINPAPGTYSYYVTANFTQGESGPSNTVEASIYPAPVINYQDGFEGFSDFATDLSPWFSYDLDNANTMEFLYSDFPGEGNPMSFMVFNPDTAVPAMPEFTPFHGDKVLVCFPPLDGANNDWISSPKWNTGNQARMRFRAKSVFTDNGLAQIKIGYNLTSPQPGGMIIISGDEPLAVPAEWTVFDYILTGNTYSNLFAGVQCLSDNGSVLLIDKFELWSSYVENEDEVNVQKTVLHQNKPNPFHPDTRIEFELKDANAPTRLTVLNIKGQTVKVLFDGKARSTFNSYAWDGRDSQGKPVSSGIYYYKLESGSFNQIRKMLLIK